MKNYIVFPTFIVGMMMFLWGSRMYAGGEILRLHYVPLRMTPGGCGVPVGEKQLIIVNYEDSSLEDVGQDTFKGILPGKQIFLPPQRRKIKAIRLSMFLKP